MMKPREKQLIKLGLDGLGVDLRSEISSHHTDNIIEFIKAVIHKLSKTHYSYVYYPHEADLDYLREFYDPNRHIFMGDIAVQIEINSIAGDWC